MPTPENRLHLASILTSTGIDNRLSQPERQLLIANADLAVAWRIVYCLVLEAIHQHESTTDRPTNIHAVFELEILLNQLKDGAGRPIFDSWALPQQDKSNQREVTYFQRQTTKALNRLIAISSGTTAANTAAFTSPVLSDETDPVEEMLIEESSNLDSSEQDFMHFLCELLQVEDPESVSLTTEQQGLIHEALEVFNTIVKIPAHNYQEMVEIAAISTPEDLHPIFMRSGHSAEKAGSLLDVLIWVVAEYYQLRYSPTISSAIVKEVTHPAYSAYVSLIDLIQLYQLQDEAVSPDDSTVHHVELTDFPKQFPLKNKGETDVEYATRVAPLFSLTIKKIQEKAESEHFRLSEDWTMLMPDAQVERLHGVGHLIDNYRQLFINELRNQVPLYPQSEVILIFIFLHYERNSWPGMALTPNKKRKAIAELRAALHLYLGLQ